MGCGVRSRHGQLHSAEGAEHGHEDEYAEDLERNLRSLLERAKSGTYRAPAVRRVHIPKGDGSKRRPIGIPTFEDKILQRAVLVAGFGTGLTTTNLPLIAKGRRQRGD